MAEAAIYGGAALAGAYMQYRSSSKATKAQQQAQDQAAQAERERMAEERRRYQERWDDYLRRYQEWDQRRREAQGSTGGLNPGSRQRSPGSGDTQQQQSQSFVPAFGVNPATGQRRSLADIATSWSDWSQYGLS